MSEIHNTFTAFIIHDEHIWVGEIFNEHLSFSEFVNIDYLIYIIVNMK